MSTMTRFTLTMSITGFVRHGNTRLRTDDRANVIGGPSPCNGVAGYRFEVMATDQGEPGRNRDTFEVTITAPDATVVARANGKLTAGNVQSVFMPKLSFLSSLPRK
jgi:hypothetical protein